jgi:hypothetical protein
LRKNFILVDYENVQPEELPALAQPELFFIKLFIGPANARINVDLAAALQPLGSNVEYIKLATGGKNALDFHIACYLGRLLEKDPKAYFHIISKDTGFDPLIKALVAEKFHVYRCGTLGDIPCLKAAALAVKPGVAAPKVVSSALAKKHVAAAKKQSPSAASASDVQPALEYLNRPKLGKPRTLETLRRSLLTHLKSTHSASHIEQMIDALLKRELIRKDAKDKITYHL